MRKAARKNARRAPRDDDGLLQSVLNALPHWITLKDLQGRYLMVNTAMGDAYESSPEEFIGHSTPKSPLGKWENVRLIEQYDQIVCKTGKPLEVPQHKLKLPGERMEIRRMLVLPLFGEQGETTGVVSWSEDITGRMKSEVALRLNQKKFRATIDQTPSAIFLKGLDGRYEIVNRGFEEMFGILAADAVGKTTHELFPAEYADRYGAQDQQVLETKQVAVEEFEVPLPGGAARTVVSSKYPVFGGSGQAIGVGTITTDVTEQRKIEQHLLEAQKMESVGRLAGGIAHDFNNLLQVIICYTHFVRANLHSPEKSLQYLDTVLGASEKAANLTRQLLAMGRKGLLEKKHIDLNKSISDLMKMVGRLIGENIDLEVKQGSELHQVEADQGMMEQVIMNLCVNARDAMPDGGRLIIETKNFLADHAFCHINGWEHPGHYTMLSVSDSGAGMAPEIRERVFEPFFTTKEPGKGTGLGLAMVYNIVQQHGGMINVYSEPDAGTTFNIYLPQAAGNSAAQDELETTDAAGGDETILVAEDDEAVRILLTGILYSKGYQVLTAEDGMEAVKVFKKNKERIDLVILDVVMPKLNGRKIFKRIRKIKPDVEVLFNTGYAANAVDAEFLSGRGLRLIQKPYSPNTLLGIVREAFNRTYADSPN